MRAGYQAVYIAGLLATDRNPVRYVHEYKKARGMDWSHDVHDWLGGYPYEPIEPAEALRLLHELGFVPVRVFEKPTAIMGLLSSHCDEYAAARRPT